MIWMSLWGFSVRQFFHKLFQGLSADQRGVTSIEYGLIVAAVTLTVMTAYFFAGDALETVFSSMSSQLEHAQSQITE